jgi:hypothetical protein
MKAQVNTLSIQESQCEPADLTGRRVTFPVCFSGCDGTPHRVGTQWGSIINTKKDFCPTCKHALYWVTERK